MRTAIKYTIGRTLPAVRLLAALAIVSLLGQAQTGDNAVYNSTGSIATSSAFIDATPFGSSTSPHPTICSILYTIIKSSTYPVTGAVIDARGLINNTNASFTCAQTFNETPWQSGADSTYQDKPSIILLPAGTITIYYTWILPNTTKLVGQGAATPVTSGSQTGTVIASADAIGTGVFSGPTYNPTTPLPMIQFGAPGAEVGDSSALTCTHNPGICVDISIEDLSLNGAGTTSQVVDGILNLDSQELTYVRRVGFYNLTGTGLQVGTSNYSSKSQNSGPFEQIYSSSTSTTGHCAHIYGAPTRGIHGITCLGNTTTLVSGGGILLDSTSNSIEDVHVAGFTNGIVVGSASPAFQAWGNLLSNVSGGGSSSATLIHLCSATSCTSTGSAVQDITILGATSSGGATTILDDVTGVSLSDTSVGMYALGEAQALTTASGSPSIYGYSRFSTSPTVPSWYVGSTQSPPTSCTSVANGSIYSATGTTGTGTLWGCIAGNWVLLE